MLNKIFKWGAAAQIMFLQDALAFKTVEIDSIKDPSKGASFVLVGDFGDMSNKMKRATHVFEAINEMKKNAKPGTPEDFDFFVTAGDNLYPHSGTAPTDDEFD